ncbi:MAG TPA: hypothetical protein DEA08_19545 [Planctomycetes bacterium]|nr:hypothetical protein [Planctomycetota bacterium]
MTIRKVLLVDDEPDIRKIGTLALERVGGLEVTQASSGLEALELAVAAAPDVILLDVMMPELDGPATFSRLRELPELADTPIVFLTAKVQKNEVERYMELGAKGVIKKPFDPMTLADEVRRVADGT